MFRVDNVDRRFKDFDIKFHTHTTYYITILFFFFKEKRIL